MHCINRVEIVFFKHNRRVPLIGKIKFCYQNKDPIVWSTSRLTYYEVYSEYCKSIQ